MYQFERLNNSQKKTPQQNSIVQCHHCHLQNPFSFAAFISKPIVILLATVFLGSAAHILIVVDTADWKL